jgi:hypothetical protein
VIFGEICYFSGGFDDLGEIKPKVASSTLARLPLNKTLNKSFPPLPDEANGCRLPHL